MAKVNQAKHIHSDADGVVMHLSRAEAMFIKGLLGNTGGGSQTGAALAQGIYNSMHYPASRPIEEQLNVGKCFVPCVVVATNIINLTPLLESQINTGEASWPAN